MSDFSRKILAWSIWSLFLIGTASNVGSAILHAGSSLFGWPEPHHKQYGLAATYALAAGMVWRLRRPNP